MAIKKNTFFAASHIVNVEKQINTFAPWNVYQMVTKNTLRPHEGNKTFLKSTFRFVAAFDLKRNALKKSNN